MDRDGGGGGGSGGGWEVKVGGVPADASLLLVSILVTSESLRLEELFVAEEAGEEPDVPFVVAAG